LKIEEGVLIAKNSYAWDGASGPAMDTPKIMVGSLAHDCFYNLMRLGLLPTEYKLLGDDYLRQLCLESKMNRFRAWYIYEAVKHFGKQSTLPKNLKPILEAY